VPELTAELIAIFQIVIANEERMRAAGLNELSAEFMARGIAGNGQIGVVPVHRYVKIAIPKFSSFGREWPIDHDALMRVRIAEDLGNIQRAQREQVEHEREMQRQATEREKSENGDYIITAKPSTRVPVRIPIEFGEYDLPTNVGNMASWRGRLPHKIAEQLQNIPHLSVEFEGRGRGQ
jgi:hypothetical protein